MKSLYRKYTASELPRVASLLAQEFENRLEDGYAIHYVRLEFGTLCVMVSPLLEERSLAIGYHSKLWIVAVWQCWRQWVTHYA
jgi:hypothetical protein